jgi:hypothetical protein
VRPFVVARVEPFEGRGLPHMATDNSQDKWADKAAQAKPATRVDRAHARSGDPAPVVEPPFVQARPHEVPAIGADCPEVTAAQVRLQASQLASHLQRQQAAIDHREAELNARVAAMENQIRAARLWLDERQGELSAREHQIAHREAAQGSHAADSLQESAHAPQREYRQPSELADVQGESLESQRIKLVEAEKRLEAEQANWQLRFRELSEQRAEFASYVELERQKLAEQRRQTLESREAEQRELKRQEADLANRTAALVGLRAEVQRAQQEALEMRLATEELWSKLAADYPAESLADSMAQIRLKLAEEFRLAKLELLRQRADIKQLAERLNQQHQKATEQRAQAQSWLSSKLQELEQFSARVRIREQQVATERAALREEMAQWQAERCRLEQEIRRLSRLTGGARSNSAA